MGESVLQSVRCVHKTTDIVMKYLDEAQDLCTLCPASFPDFLERATEHNGTKILKVEVTGVPESKDDTASPTPRHTQAHAESFEAKSSHRPENVFANLIDMGIQAIKGF